MNTVYCPHCWAEITGKDTTCWQCGEKVEHEAYPVEKNDVTPSMISLVFMGIAAWSTLGLFAYFKGWFA